MNPQDRPYNLHDSTGYWLTRVFRTMHGYLSERLAHEGFIVGYWPILSALGENRAETVAEIATFVGMEPIAATRLIDQIEDDGLIRRLPDPREQGRIFLELTPRGRETLPVLRAASLETNERYLKDLSDEEITQFRDTLKKILSRTDETITEI